MVAQPIRIARLFSRREIILSSRAEPERQRQNSAPMNAHEFRILRQLLMYGEPARFELSDANFIEATSRL
jgi:hypothetical protein